MDTRAKVLTLEQARSLHANSLLVVTGYFDLLHAAHVRELEDIRRRSASATLLAVVLPWEEAYLGQRARAEMAAALRMIDYVVAPDTSDVAALAASLSPAEVVRLEAADQRRNRELIEHVHSRHSA